MRILDLACGHGRHANRLAALGHDVTGVDLMPGFLELARQDARFRGVKVDYLCEDMRQFDGRASFDRVIMLFTVFGYFSDEQNLRVLQNVARALKPGGLFVVDVPNRDMILKRLMPAIVTEKNGNLMIDRLSFDSLTGRMYNKRIVIRDGIRKDKPFSVRLYNPSEMRAWLSQAGLEMMDIFGDYDSHPVTEESRRMIILARKPEIELI
jgi:2-polyprenyl-3-methyl-5-hydroxy-6-metoxy-1,4-benzoquinol methylase